MNKFLRQINLEEGKPTVDRAIKRMTFEIARGNREGAGAIKFIHGYGSSGKGGAIRIEARSYLQRVLNKNQISAFIKGENFTIFDENTRKAFGFCPDLRNDRDLERSNNGITIVVL